MKIISATLDDSQGILALQHLAYQTEAARYVHDTIPPLLESITDLKAALILVSISTAQ